VPLVPLLLPSLELILSNRDRDDLVFTTDNATPLRLSNWRRHFNRAKQAAELDSRLTPHGLRHTAASLFIQAGTPPKVLQMIMGHASITMTLDLYGHLYPDEMDRWATRLGKDAAAILRPEDPQEEEQVPPDDPD
jgi:integrase